MKDNKEQLARRIDTLGKRIALMPFGSVGSREREERDRLCDNMNSMQAELFRMNRDSENENQLDER